MRSAPEDTGFGLRYKGRLSLLPDRIFPWNTMGNAGCVFLMNDG